MSNIKPLILVCNDDGIFSRGIRALIEVAETFGEVEVVAPDRPQSAVGHAITIMDPLRVSRFRFNDHLHGYAVSGTPADCVKLAHDKLLGRRPDLVLSGINHGSNAGINVIYSGTVSAAKEGSILGYKSLAVSCTSFDEEADMSGTQRAAEKAVDFILNNDVPRGITYNLNAPPGEFIGLKWAHVADSRYVDEYDGRIDPMKRPYYWLQGSLEILDAHPDADLSLLDQGFATLTPLQFDITSHKHLEGLKNKFTF